MLLHGLPPLPRPAAQIPPPRLVGPIDGTHTILRLPHLPFQIYPEMRDWPWEVLLMNTQIVFNYWEWAVMNMGEQGLGNDRELELELIHTDIFVLSLMLGNHL